MRSENTPTPYLSAIVRDGTQPFRYRSGVMRLLGIAETGSAFVGSCLRVPPSMKRTAFPMSRRAYFSPDMYLHDAGDSAGKSSKPGHRTDEEQTAALDERQNSRLQQEPAGQGASGDHERLHAERSGNSSQPSAADTGDGLQTGKHCPDPKERHDRSSPNLRRQPPGLEPSGTGSPAGVFHQNTGGPHEAGRDPGTSGKRGLSDAGGAAPGMNVYTQVDLSMPLKAEAPRVPDLTSIVPSVAGGTGPSSADHPDDASPDRGETRDIPSQEFSEGRRPHVVRSSKQRDRVFSEGLLREDSCNCADSGKHQVADEERLSYEYPPALRKERPFSGGGAHTQRRFQRAETEAGPVRQAAPAVQPQQVVIVRQQSASLHETAAFWERSYLSRLRLRSVR